MADASEHSCEFLPCDRVVGAEGDAPAVWLWICAGCVLTEHRIGDPALEDVEAADRAFAPHPPTVVTHVSRPHDVYVGRRGKGQDGYFGNPVAEGRRCPVCARTHYRDDVTPEGDLEMLVCWRAHFREKLARDREYRDRVAALRGKRLACFCKRRGDEPCHADDIAAHCDRFSRERPRWRALVAEMRARPQAA